MRLDALLDEDVQVGGAAGLGDQLGGELGGELGGSWVAELGG